MKLVDFTVILIMETDQLFCVQESKPSVIKALILVSSLSMACKITTFVLFDYHSFIDLNHEKEPSTLLSFLDVWSI